MLDKGIDALKYKVIILDEVHERSVESDLVLACVKQFMVRNHNLRFEGQDSGLLLHFLYYKIYSFFHSTLI